MLLASPANEVAAVRAAKELPGLASFEHEAKRAALRRRRRGDAAKAASGGCCNTHAQSSSPHVLQAEVKKQVKTKERRKRKKHVWIFMIWYSFMWYSFNYMWPFGSLTDPFA
jgi:hypothetical protein